jgi:hypothetical protein
MPRRWLPHPPRTIRPRTCPTQPRFASVALAQAALPASVADTRLTATPCDQCGGAHHTAR